MYIFTRRKVVLCILFIFIKFLLNIIFGTLGGTLFSFSSPICLCLTYIYYFLSFRCFCFVWCLQKNGTPQVTINFNELPVTFVIKRGMFQARENVQVVFTVGPRSILAEFPLSNSIEPLRGLERANKPAPSNDRPLTKKAVKNQKRRSDKCVLSLAHPS